jgi:metallo-beta-lactamase family protein
VAYREWFEVRPGLRAMYHDAGHILGSASITLEETHNGSTKRIVFTGDIGRPNTPILRDPQPPPSGADLVISESTYGDRDHAPVDETEDKLCAIFDRTFKRGGRVIIPAFALGRTQTLMVALRNLQRVGRLPTVPVYVDSPLACNATDIFMRHPECYDKESMETLRKEGSLFALDGYACLREASDSKALNRKKEPSIIIAASGMCEAGRILHHLENNMEDSRNTILIVGYQAENTLGRKLVEGWKEVKVYGMERQVRAEVAVLNGMSAHAGQSEMRGYLNGCRPQGPVFLVHGERTRQETFKTHLLSQGYPDVRIPAAGDVFQV